MLGVETIDSDIQAIAVSDNGDEMVFRNDETVIDERMNAAPVPPMQRCKRRHIPAASFIRTDHIALHEATHELRLAACDQSFEIVYDRATTKDCVMAGHHVYRVIRYGGARSDDILQLEFSCKKDFSKAWTPENARDPGMWIVDHFKKMDKARRSGDRARIEADISSELEDANAAIKAEARKDEIHMSQEFAKDVDKYARRNTISVNHKRKPK